MTEEILLALTSTVDWKYNLSTYCTCSPQVYVGSEWVTTNRATPHP